jgi:cyclopropane-fatty-acyl-phospholipid synthase
VTLHAREEGLPHEPDLRVASRSAPGASAAAIEHHYDVSNEFYRLWLDDLLSYSCALWDGAGTLEEAQVAKIELHIAAARCQGATRVLDVGCGWGATLRRLVHEHGVERAVGLTLSKNQAAWIEERAWPGVLVRVESWADHDPGERYDAIVSMGAFEHFARLDASPEDKIAGYRQFFERCHGWLRPGGWMSLQTIAYGNSSREDFSPLFATEIFPESDLPRLSEIAAASDRLFEVVALRNDREQYERTVREWRRRLLARRDEATAIVGEPIFRRYDRFLQLLGIGFHVGSMGLFRITLRRIDSPARALPRRG